MCSNCLRGNHHPKNCLSSGCLKCGKRHFSLLHFTQKGSNQSSESIQSNKKSDHPPISVSNYQIFIPYEVVLATDTVNVLDKEGKFHTYRVMLNSGSQPHVITENQLADDERERFPIPSAILKRDFYVDDLLTGTSTFESALSLFVMS